MHIGLVIYGSLDTLSGGYLYDRHLVAHLEALGARVTVFARPWRHYLAHLSDNLAPSWRRALLHARVDLWLQDELNHPSLFGLNRALARAQPRVPRVGIVHHLRVDERHPRLWRPLYRAVERAYLHTLTAALYNSRTTQAAVAALRGAALPGLVAYPGKDNLAPPPLSPADLTARAHQPGPLRALAVGNLIPRKGLHVLLDALRRLPPGTVTLDIVGRDDVDPAYTRGLRARVQRWGLAQAVRFHGRVEGAALAGLYRRAHVFTLPSQYEGYGIVYAEALGFGLPVLAGNRGAAGEIITSGREGVLVDPDDAAAIARHLAAWAADRARLAAQAVAARARYDQLPTWAESMSRAARWLLRLAARGAGQAGASSSSVAPRRGVQ